MKIPRFSTPHCYHGVWDNRTRLGFIENIEVAVKQERGDKCFFWPYHEGMSFEAAETLQKRSVENKQLKKSHLLTQIGLYISALGVVGGLVYAIIKDFCF